LTAQVFRVIPNLYLLHSHVQNSLHFVVSILQLTLTQDPICPPGPASTDPANHETPGLVYPSVGTLEKGRADGHEDCHFGQRGVYETDDASVHKKGEQKAPGASV